MLMNIYLINFQLERNELFAGIVFPALPPGPTPAQTAVRLSPGGMGSWLGGGPIGPNILVWDGGRIIFRSAAGMFGFPPIPVPRFTILAVVDTEAEPVGQGAVSPSARACGSAHLRLRPPALAAGGTSATVCAACPAGTYYGSTGACWCLCVCAG